MQRSGVYTKYDCDRQSNNKKITNEHIYVTVFEDMGEIYIYPSLKIKDNELSLKEAVYDSENKELFILSE